MLDSTPHSVHRRWSIGQKNLGYGAVLLMFVAAVLALYCLFCLLFYSPQDPAWSSTGENSAYLHHPLGYQGAYISDVLLSLFGYAAYVVPLLLIAWPLTWLLCRPSKLQTDEDEEQYFSYKTLFNIILASLLLPVSLAGMLSAHWHEAINSLAVSGGGMVGQLLLNMFVTQGVSLNTMMILLTIGVFVSLVGLFPHIFFALCSCLGRWALNLSGKISQSLQKQQNHYQRSQPQEPILQAHSGQDSDQRLFKRLKCSVPEPSVTPLQPLNDVSSQGRRILPDETSRPLDDEFLDDALLDEHLLDNAWLEGERSEHVCEDSEAKSSPTTPATQESAFPHHRYGGMSWQDFKAQQNFSLDETNSDDDNDAQGLFLPPCDAAADERLSSAMEEEEKHSESFFTVPGTALHAVLSQQPHGVTTASAYEREAQGTEISPNSSFAQTRRFKSQRLQREREEPAKFSQANFSHTNMSNASMMPHGNGKLPHFALLNPAPAPLQNYSEEELANLSAKLEKILNDYKLNAKVKNTIVGPVATRFEIQLAPGTRVSQISSIEKDLARSLAVSSVRVQEVIDGKPYIGLEIPNRTRETVYFRQVIDSEEFARSTSPLTICLGLDISRQPIVKQLEKCPHLLVAGTTGSGKSVGINIMLNSMLYKSTPEELRLILIDPKMLEMSLYEDIPHLLTPVITDMQDAQNALRWTVAEMERRYQLMSHFKVRNIKGFNQFIREQHLQQKKVYDPLYDPDNRLGLLNQIELEALPYIVVVIDELADLMMVAGKKVEELIVRLAAKARACGIHLILATQRPSVDVITGLIKANVPTRIAFQVSSKVDSRTILDQNGAESLLGSGDMLFMAAGKQPLRVHGAFISDSEVERITDFLRAQGKPNYVDDILQGAESEQLGALGSVIDDNSDDEKYEEAVKLIEDKDKISISALQRSLGIGYNRAARLVDAMECNGLIGGAVGGNNSRVVLKNKGRT